MARSQRDEVTVIANPNQDGSGIFIDDTQTIANGTANVTISNVAPSGVGTATISGWIPIRIGTTIVYIPYWT